MKKFLPAVCALCVFLIAAGPLAAGERGIASWYGGKFHGRLTANGEIFDTGKLTAAHRTLPFNTQVKVTNLNNGKSVIVRINDRGPFLHGRIIDLSQAAAMKIDMVESGTAPVTVELLPASAAAAAADDGLPSAAAPRTAATAPASGTAGRAAPLTGTVPLPEPEPPETVTPRTDPAPRAATGALPAADSDALKLPRPSFPGTDEAASRGGSWNPKYRIQLGSFSIANNARSLKDDLERAGFLPRLEEAGNFTRVVLTGLTDTEVSRALTSLERSGFRDYIVRAD